MPTHSKRQNRAMHAAKAGKSTLGIPKSVGKKMLAHKSSHKSSKKASPKGRKYS